MSTIVTEDFEKNTAKVENKEKATDVLLVVKDPKFPSLFRVVWSGGKPSKEFDMRFTDKVQAMQFAEDHMDNMRMKQSVKNRHTKEKYEKKKAKELGENTEERITVR